jgi:hypothetical protein
VDELMAAVLGVDAGARRSAALARLARAAELVADGEAEVVEAVSLARLAGASWAEVAGRLGCCRQAAWSRFHVRQVAAERAAATRTARARRVGGRRRAR